MQKRVSSLLFLALAIAPITVAKAATYSSFGYLYSLNVDPANGNSQDDTTDLCSNVQGTAEANCGGNSSYQFSSDGYVYLYDYTAQAQAFSGVLKVGTSLTSNIFDSSEVSGINYSSLPELPNTLGIFAQADIFDSWTITGGTTGSAGTVRLAFHMDGENAGSDIVGNTLIRSITNLDGRSFDAQSNSYNGADFVQFRVDGTYDNDYFLDIPIIFGQLSNVTLSLSAFSEVSDPDRNLPIFSTFSDFFNTATISGLTVLDASGKTVGFDLTSQSNDSFFQGFSTGVGPMSPVPVSSSVLFSMSGIGLLALMRRRRRIA